MKGFFARRTKFEERLARLVETMDKKYLNTIALVLLVGLAAFSIIEDVIDPLPAAKCPCPCAYSRSSVR